MGTAAADLDVRASTRGIRAVVVRFDSGEGRAFPARDGRDIAR
jgi:hypothetical protein